MSDIPDVFRADGHVCFGCKKPITDYKEHIHFGLDEWAGRQGLVGVGLDDLFQFTFCEACTQKSDNGWVPEAHEVTPPSTTGAQDA